MRLATVAVLLALAALVSADARAECETLYKRIAESQIQKDTKYIFPNIWSWNKGLWRSFVHFNLVGNPAMTLLRNKFVIGDNNVFTAIWITEMLMEADALGVVSVEPQVVNDALKAIVGFGDKNFPDSGRWCFWEQREVNGTWVANPKNLRIIGGDGVDVLEWIAEMLRILGQEDLYEKIVSLIPDMVHGFDIPADFDDTYCNQALGGLLRQAGSKFSEALGIWQSANTEAAARRLDAATLQYSYRPFDKDPDYNTIDPRTYFFMRQYFETKYGSTPFSLPGTWIQTLSESQANFSKGYAMPFNVNNIDASVLGNVLLGLTQRFVAAPGDVAWLTPDMLKLYEGIGNYLAWVIADGPILEREDIGLMYYPNVYAFFWFCSRTIEFLDQVKASGSVMPAEFEYVRGHLGAALSGEVTSFLLENQINGKYWQQWLGNGDRDILGIAVQHGEDRIFTTATALNTLYDVWAVRSPDGGLKWLPETPENVKKATAAGAEYLTEHANKHGTSLANVFFSGSLKGDGTFPYFYPANRILFNNGTQVPADLSVLELHNSMSVGLSGIVSEDDYQRMVSQTHFGFPTPVSFGGFNKATFPYWSCEPLTQAATLLALSRHVRLEA